MPLKKPPKQHADFSALLATLPALQTELERLRAELPPVDLDALLAELQADTAARVADVEPVDLDVLLDELKRDVFGPPATPPPASD